MILMEKKKNHYNVINIFEVKEYGESLRVPLFHGWSPF